MGEVGMAWRCLYRLAGTKKYPRARRQKNDRGGKRARSVEGYGIGKTERKRKRDREGRG